MVNFWLCWEPLSQRATALCAKPGGAVGRTHPETGCDPKKLVLDQTAKWDSGLFSPVK